MDIYNKHKDICDYIVSTVSKAENEDELLTCLIFGLSTLTLYCCSSIVSPDDYRLLKDFLYKCGNVKLLILKEAS